ncbi:DEAD/DEAH box helicase [Paenibacillus polymyxa]|uniref:DEAD/DEAH box helicase n=1 Tax=Paenibacillus polymyxa TaxID=1406 RepID=UPI0025B6F46D|nr:helicase-related protein [Paenibacillus polymyxa]MDN4081853.1 helicase-related protein [Paenibacillus polymyxa]MDN4088915.1 helicase-related protein [Paenibacillus polymyxa]MDN4109292.1 helicase-related protein [Paenibacillus polymyxa]
MKIAVYAVRYKGNWNLRLSVDIRVDMTWWWCQDKHQENAVERWVLLGDELPLSWGVSLCGGFRELAEMERWGDRQWWAYTLAQLKNELVLESSNGERILSGGVDNICIWDRHQGWVSRTKHGNEGRETIGTVRSIQNRKLATGVNGLDMECLTRQANELTQLLAGRQLLVPEAEALLAEAAPDLEHTWRSAAQLAYLQGRLSFAAGLAPAPRARWSAARRQELRCNRCGSEKVHRTSCASCGRKACAYCETCLTLGRSRECSLLLRGTAKLAMPRTAEATPAPNLDRWGLSPAQRAAAEAALCFLAAPPEGGRKCSRLVGWQRAHELFRRSMRARQELGAAAAHGSTLALNEQSSPKSGERAWEIAGRQVPDSAAERFLLWAVTGAGKTEMMFPLLQHVLERGGTALVATPRRDVVLELAPRLAVAFPQVSMVTLYGGSTERWQRGQLTLATTHQLLRYRHSFDLVVIDEIDAFPYHNDPMLAFAAQAVCKREGKFIYLSATPPRPLQKEAARGQLPHAKVPVRFHRHPLPVPIRLGTPPVHQWLQKGQLPASFVQRLNVSIQRGAQLFLFVTRISHIQGLVELLIRQFPDIPIAGTSSQDEERTTKVRLFRATEIRVLVTTTILERGVTVPRSDVYVLDADSSLFDEASLVQMAGRAGRSKDDPCGSVIFISPQWTSGQKRAIKQIKRMNALARKKGYLKLVKH